MFTETKNDPIVKPAHRTRAIAMVLALILCLSTAAATASSPDPLSEELFKIAKPHQAALEFAMKNDLHLKKNMEAYRLAAHDIIGRKIDEKLRESFLQDLNSKYRPDFERLFKAAKIDETQYKKSAETAIHKMGQKRGKKYHAKYLGFLAYLWQEVRGPYVVHPADKEVQLTAPFPFAQREDNGAGEVFVDKVHGTYSTYARVDLLGGHDNIAGLAHFQIMDDTYTRIEVAAALPETFWSVSAFAELAVSGSKASSRIDVLSNNHIVCSQELEHASIVAPFLWYVYESGTDNVVVGCEFAAPEQGDEVVIRFTSDAGAWAAGAAFSSADIEAAPRDLRVRMKY